ncbi:MAG TPA: saccharopine dehydrogenase NADP-binding domain-containing protein, partial [Solirubrobacterales bacterium]|nr:saccharopine dehydrogenase NADP-binding domain-containing protein [Solirubrobacterales bacterium]
MPLLSRQNGPIAVYGATGYTGRLVVAELVKADADFIVAGRNPRKLDALRAELSPDAPARAAALDQPASLRELLADCAVVINCAGPFVRFGEPVLAAAVETGTHYLDTTGEQPYMKMAFERYGPGAARAGVAVVPAMGFDYVPGDMIASLTADGMGELDEVSMHYSWHNFKPSQGTARTTVEIIRSGGLEWRDLAWVEDRGGASRGIYEFPAPVGRQRMMRYPAGEQITVPRHIPTRNVRTSINAGDFASDRLAQLFTALVGPIGVAMRTPLRRAAAAAISRLPEGPTPEQREKMQWTIVCDAVRGEVERKGVISGKDVYGLTAAAITRGAILASRRGFDARG